MLLVVNENVINNIKIDIANNSFTRMKGLMFKKEIINGLLITPCNSIHTFFMKADIDVIYLNKKGEVVRIDKCMIPWKIGKIIFKAFAVLELPSGSIDKYNIKLNDIIKLQSK